MRRGEFHVTGGCDPEAGSSGTRGRCWLCGVEWEEENCCNTTAHCPCMALATGRDGVSYKNIVLYVCYLFGKLNPYEYFWEKWYS